MGSEDGEMWKQIREESREHRHDKQNWSKELLDQWCLDNGVELRSIAEWQFRLTKANKKIDIYPQRQKYHNLKNNTRGRYKDLIEFVANHFKNN
jgi:hypothetical protein